MQKIFGKLYALYALLIFGVVFMLLFPVFMLMIAFPNLQSKLYFTTQLWGRLSLFFIGLPVKLHFEEEIKKKNGPYIICANHFSLLDIIAFAYTPFPLKFMGKNTLANIPLFGYMFKKLHISVKRESPKDGKRALDDAARALEEGFSLVIFPEGGIFNHHQPIMRRFKDGAFLLAIDKQIPILPVSFPDNWIILPDEPWPTIKWRKLRVHYHKTVDVKKYDRQYMGELKNDVYNTIQNQLDLYLKK